MHFGLICRIYFRSCLFPPSISLFSPLFPMSFSLCGTKTLFLKNVLTEEKREAWANWSKRDFPLILVAELQMNPRAQMNLYSFCGSWVMLQMVSQRKFSINRPQLKNYIKLLFIRIVLYWCFKHILTIDQIIQNNDNWSFAVERPWRVTPSLKTKS